MTMTTDRHPSEDRVRDALRGVAAGMDLTAPGVETVRTSAHHRNRRQQRVTVGIAAAAVVAGGVGIAGLVTRDDDVRFEPGAVGNTPSGTTFTWVEGEEVLSPQPQIVQGADGVLYALSTAPGVTYEDAEGGVPLPQAIYRSTDGIAWEPTELGSDLQLATLDIREDGVLYGLSTAPGNGTLRVATSADGGTTWQLEDLPTQTPQPTVADGVVLTSGGSQMDVASNGATTVVTVQRQWWVQPDGFISPEELENSWLVPTEAGLEVHSNVITGDGPVPARPPAAQATPVPTAPAADGTVPTESAALAEAGSALSDVLTEIESETQVLRTIPWAEIGLTGPQDLVISDTYTATDGTGWTPVDLPVQGVSAEVEATAEGFVAILHRQGFAADQPSPMQVARSADGLSWTLDEAPLGEAVYTTDVGTIGDRIVVAAVSGYTGPDSTETTVVSSSADGGRSWTATDLTALVPLTSSGGHSFVGAFDIGPLGVAAAVSTVDPESGELRDSWLLYSPDGAGWDVVPGDQFGDDGNGISWLSVDADRIIVSIFQTDNSVRTVVGIPTR